MKVRAVIFLVIFLSGLLIVISVIKKQEMPQTGPVLDIGMRAPEFILNDPTGNTYYTLEKLKGSVVLINFWASWCEPCREEMPSIQSLYNHFKDNKQFSMLTVLYKDDYQNAKIYIKESNFEFPVLIDMDSNTANSYGVTGVPETYIIDKKGFLRERIIGQADWSSPEAISFISDLIKE